MPVDSQAFKQAMAQFAAGVTVVTTPGRDRPIGLTANSFTSVSIDPPLVLVCIQTQLQAHQAIQENRVFAVNLLGAHQLDHGMRFAGLHKDVRDRFYPKENLRLERLSGLDDAMADAVTLKFLPAPLTKPQQDELFKFYAK